MGTAAKSVERMARLRQPGFPGAGGKRIVSERALQGIIPMITQAIIDQKDRDKSPTFTSIDETDPRGPGMDALFESALNEMIRHKTRREE